MDRVDAITLRCELIAAKNQLASIAAEYEANGDTRRAGWLRTDVERADAALAGAGAYVAWCRQREEALRAA